MEIQHQKKTEEYVRKNKSRYGNARIIIPWIETLLQTPIEDYRKHAVDLILAPYLINIHRLQYNEAFNTIMGWLDKCNQVRRLDSNFKSRVKGALDAAVKHNIPPMNFVTLQSRNKQLFEFLRSKIESEKRYEGRRSCK